MVASAASQVLSRPSYFGPLSQKFSSSGLAAWAAWPNANRPNTVPSATPRPVFLADEKSSRILVPTFRSSCPFAAPTFTNFGKSWALANILIPVPLYRPEVPDRVRGLWRRDFRSAVLAPPHH